MERRRLVFGATWFAMVGLLGLAFFRFTDSRIKSPDAAAEEETVEPVVATSSPSLIQTTDTAVAAQRPVTEKPKPLPVRVKLDVPFVTETPDGVWNGPWKNACEEASLVMVEALYLGKSELPAAEAKKRMTELFAIQDEIWKSNANSDAARTAKIANDHMAFKAALSEAPTLDQVKRELAAGHPVIAPVNGKELGNPNIPFLASGSFYHMLVITGYDDATGEFITNDDGDEKAGAGRRYKYGPFLASVHDYVYRTKTTDGPMRMILTSEK
jgi:hypothetical protein